MALQNPFVVHDQDVYALTGRGNRELSASETGLSPAEIELLVRVDGHSTASEVKSGVHLLAANAFSATLQMLVREGYVDLASNEQTISLDFTEFFSTKPRPPSSKVAARAKSQAASGVSALQKQGYYVRIARRRATTRKLARGAVVTVVLVEDDPSLAKYLKQCLEYEGLAARIAGNRAEIIAAFRGPPLPDLVLLDVMLPDADGFDVLLKMRQHPILKAVPVIMLTAKATREAVLKGLAAGADGYVTKPIDADAVIKAVKSVIGLPGNPFEKRSKGS